MSNDPAAVEWLEKEFEKQFRPGGGQRIDMNHAGSRGEYADLLAAVRPEAAPVLPRRTRLAWLRKLWGR